MRLHTASSSLLIDPRTYTGCPWQLFTTQLLRCIGCAKIMLLLSTTCNAQALTLEGDFSLRKFSPSLTLFLSSIRALLRSPKDVARPFAPSLFPRSILENEKSARVTVQGIDDVMFDAGPCQRGQFIPILPTRPSLFKNFSALFSKSGFSHKPGFSSRLFVSSLFTHALCRSRITSR